MRVALLVPFLASAVLSSSYLLAQEGGVVPVEGDEQLETYGHSRHGETFDEGPRSAASLMPGLGDAVHFPVAGISAEAQKFFNQGVTQQHGFWHFEAERSFRQVALLHPECAMAYWGMARANDEHAERAAGFLASAVQRSKDAPKREQAWIDAWAAYYQIDAKQREELRSGDKKRIEVATKAIVEKAKARKKELLDKLDKKLLKDLGTIVFDYPEDIEAKAFLAIQNWLAYRWGGGVQIVSHTAVNAILDQVFAVQPLHPAHHYRIHLWDREDGRRALDSASKNGFSAPAIAHQWHMPGHIYAKLNRHFDASWQQEASGRADHAHMMRDGVMPFLIHNYGHNQEWMARSMSHSGRTDEALRIAMNLAELPRHPDYNQITGGGSIAGYGQKRLVQICEDHGLWQRAIDLVDKGFLERSDEVSSEVERLGLLGRAYYRLGRKDDATRTVAEVGQLLAKARAKRATAIDEAEEKAYTERKKRNEMTTAIATASRRPNNAVQSVLSLQRELNAERLLAEGDAKAALKEVDGVRGIPMPLMAGLRVAAGETKKAIEQLEKENKKNPNRAATMVALAKAYEAHGAESKPELRELVLALAKIAEGDFLTSVGYPPNQKTGLGLRLTVPNDDNPLFPDTRHGDGFGKRPSLSSIGPRCWAPVANPGFDLASAAINGVIAYGNKKAAMALNADGSVVLRGGAAGERTETGRAKLVVFYLGFGCLHCVEQLHLLRPAQAQFAELGVDIVAIGSDTAPNIHQASLDLPAAERMPFPMLADPKLKAFKAWRCHDDFENMPLHGTFLIDAKGRIRWQDISYEPFTKIDWLVNESRRLLALPMVDAAR
ncbi:MAG: peroxiredoxin [Planctomycetota bacterium]|jgi:peroxiredoxin